MDFKESFTRRVALLNGEKLGLDMVVFTRISLARNDERSLLEFERRVRLFPEVVECYTVTGSADYFLKIVTRDIKHYERFMRRQLLQIPEVRDVSSNVAVTQIKYTTDLPIDTEL